MGCNLGTFTLNPYRKTRDLLSWRLKCFFHFQRHSSRAVLVLTDVGMLVVMLSVLFVFYGQ